MKSKELFSILLGRPLAMFFFGGGKKYLPQAKTVRFGAQEARFLPFSAPPTLRACF